MEDKKFYLTKEGLEKLKKEHKYLEDLKFAKVNGEEAPKVLHSEDLDPEYLTFQEDLTFIETKLAELDNILKNAELIKAPVKEKKNMVDLGATVVINVGGQEDEFTLVGSLEANPSLGKISNESPVGKALMGRKLGEEITINSPIKMIYKIKKIKYNFA